MGQALGKLQTRTMVIQGSDDNIVSNELVSSAMKQMCHNSITKVVLKGSVIISMICIPLFPLAVG